MHECHGGLEAFGYFIYKLVSLIQVLLNRQLIAILVSLLVPPSPLPLSILLSFIHIHHLFITSLPNILLICSILVLCATPHVATLCSHLIVLINTHYGSIAIELSCLPQWAHLVTHVYVSSVAVEDHVIVFVLIDLLHQGSTRWRFVAVGSNSIVLMRILLVIGWRRRQKSVSIWMRWVVSVFLLLSLVGAASLLGARPRSRLFVWIP
jgi:hypothetical protein